MNSKPRLFAAEARTRTICSIMATALTVSLAVLLAACGGDAKRSPADGGATRGTAAVSPTSTPSAGASPAVCSPRGGKAVPAGAARVLRRYVDLLAVGRVAAAQRLAAPESPAAAADGARALASIALRIAALDDHY